MSTVESLAQVPLFAELGSSELGWVASHTRTHRFLPGEEVIRQGEPGDEFFVILDGQLDILIDGRRVNVLRAGDFFGELALLFGAPRSATAVTTEDTTLLVMSSDDFEAVLREAPTVETKVLAAVAQRLRYR